MKWKGLSLSVSKRKLLAVILVPSALVIATYSVNAAYPVIDNQNIAKTIEVINKGAKQIEKLNEQIELGKQQLAKMTQSLRDVTDGTKKVLTSLDMTRTTVDSVISNTRSSFDGLLSPIKDVQKVAAETESKWNNTFKSLSQLSPKNLSYGALQGSNAYINNQVSMNNKEAVVETQAIMTGLTQAEEELKQLREQARKTEGQRDLAKISAEIDAVNARIQAFNSKLTGIQVTNQNIESQAKQQQDANRAEYNYAAAKQFSEDVVNMKMRKNTAPNSFLSRTESMKAAWR